MSKAGNIESQIDDSTLQVKSQNSRKTTGKYSYSVLSFKSVQKSNRYWKRCPTMCSNGTDSKKIHHKHHLKTKLFLPTLQFILTRYIKGKNWQYLNKNYMFGSDSVRPSFVLTAQGGLNLVEDCLATPSPLKSMILLWISTNRIGRGKPY